jgi:hypothetical protein
MKEPDKAQLERMMALGFAIFGDEFKHTLTYIQIERKLKELEEQK